MQQSPSLVLLPLLVLVPATLGQDFTELDWDAESRQLQVRSLIMFDIVHVVEDVDAYVVRCCQIQNVSLVITYTGVVVAALMMAGFLYIALNYGRGRSRYLSSIFVISRYIYNYIIYRSGYGYSYYAEDDYYDGYHYQKRALHHKQGLLIHQ